MLTKSVNVLSVHRTGGALEKALNVDDLHEVSMEQTLYDLGTEEEGEEEEQQEEDLEGESGKFPVEMKVLCEDDIIGVPVSIVYHNSLKQLVHYLSITTNECKRMDRATRQPCGASKPFDVVVKQIGTEAVVEWVHFKSFQCHQFYSILCV